MDNAILITISGGIFWVVLNYIITYYIFHYKKISMTLFFLLMIIVIFIFDKSEIKNHLMYFLGGVFIGEAFISKFLMKDLYKKYLEELKNKNENKVEELKKVIQYNDEIIKEKNEK